MLTDDDWRRITKDAAGAVEVLLDDLLPAGPDDEKPPPDWPHWQLAYKLMDAKLKLTSALADLPPQR